jgi:TonB-dependent starch-binding outer membrane protein SusC
MQLTFERKLLRVMRLTSIILLSCCLSVAAKTVSQTVTYKGTNVALEKIFTVVEQQTGYVFIYNPALLDHSAPVTINAEEMPLEKFLQNILQHQQLDYVVKEKTIAIKPKEIVAPPQPKNELLPISGVVKGVDGKPLANVSVVVKGTDKGTTTDENGNFSIDVKQGDVLVISSVGFGTREVKVTRVNDNLIVALNTASMSLDEVVVNKGYYAEKKILSTGSVAKVSGETISKQPVSDPVAALIARVPGLEVITASGVPGRVYGVQIRGRNSLNNGSTPLYVIDGVPMYNNANSPNRFGTSIDIPGLGGVGGGLPASPFNALNPKDIESIEILKDADATSIYGSRGANGVILITTKKGASGKTKVDVTFSHGIGQTVDKMELLNTEQYLEMRREAFRNDGMTTYPATAYDVNGKWEETRYTDWQEVIMGRNARYTDAQVSISGGTANTTFILSGGYNRQSTVLPGNFRDQKGSANFSLAHKNTNGKLKIDFSTLYSNLDSRLPFSDLVFAITRAPNAPTIYNADGTLNWANGTWTNPLRETKASVNVATAYLNSSFALSYQILPSLQLKTLMGYSSTNVNGKRLIPSSYYSPFSPEPASSESGSNKIFVWNIEPMMTYSKAIGKGSVEVLVGTTLLKQEQESYAVKGEGFTSDALIQNLQGAAVVKFLGNSNSEYRYNAFFGRMGFTWDEKYLLNVTGRRDGSSRFGPGKEFSNFGAVGIGWVVTKEPFAQKHIPFLDFGKIRANYGVTGNDQIGDYQYLETYTPYATDYLGIVPLNVTRLYNPDFHWEKNKKLELGVDLGFLQSRILLAVNFYTNRSDNQLVEYALPSMVGNTSVIANLPALIENRGFEFELNTVNINRDAFTWSSSINLTIPKSKLIAYPGIENSLDRFNYMIGAPLNIRKGYNYRGVEPQSGLYTYEDVDNDGMITSFSKDQETPLFIGQKFYGGLSNTFVFKGLQVDIFFQYSRQPFQPNYLALFGLPGTMSNQPVYVLERWQKPGDAASIQRFSNSDFQATSTYSMARSSTQGFSDASFIRLKNLVLSYSFPQLLKRKLFLNSLKLFVQGQNLLLFTNYKGLDPETKSLLPALRVVTGGVQITF